MTRTQLQLDDDTYTALRLRAFQERKSMSALVRDMLREGLGLAQRQDSLATVDFDFIGSGASGRGDISVRHDEALDEDFK